MLLLRVFLNTLLFLFAHAFVVPDGTPDGSYLVGYDSGGNTTMSKAEHIDSGDLQPTARDLSFAARLAKRLVYVYSFCYPTHDLNVDNTNAANAAVQTFCGNGAWLNADQAFFAKYGDVYAFVCSYDIAHRCTRSQAQEANGFTTQKCGRFNSGSTAFTQGYGPGIEYGYQVASEFCQKPLPQP